MAKYYKQNVPSLRELIKEKTEKKAFDIWDVAGDTVSGAAKGVAAAGSIAHRATTPALSAVGLNRRRLMPIGGAVLGAGAGGVTGLGLSALAANSSNPAMRALAAIGAPAAVTAGAAGGAVLGGVSGHYGRKLIDKLHKKAEDVTFFEKCAEAKDKYEETHEKIAFDILDAAYPIATAPAKAMGVNARRLGQVGGAVGGAALGGTVGAVGSTLLSQRLLQAQHPALKALGAAGLLAGVPLATGAGVLAGGYAGLKGGGAAGGQLDKLW